MLPTPTNHLPRYYPHGVSWAPEWSAAERKKYAPVWERAFQIHEGAHDFSENEFSVWLLNPVEESPPMSKTPYCDCYERAYRELEKEGKLKELGIEAQAPAPLEV